MAIGTFWPGDYNAGKAETGVGALNGALDGTTTTILLNQSTKKPAGTAATWPYLASKDSNGDGYSNSTADYVSWVRVDNEIMQITVDPVVSGSQVRLTLKRGIWGTAATSHATGAKVFSPVYIGSTEMSGAPAQNSATVELRYSLKFWLPEGYRWQADQILKTLGDGKTYAQGGKLVEYDTVWLDVSSCNQYNLADAWGNAVNNWDDLNNERMSKDNWGKYQGWKLNGQNNAGGGLRDLVKHQNPAVKVKFTGNSLLKPGSTCDRNLLANVYDGGPLEGWLKTDFASTMNQSFDIQQNDLPGLYWVRYDYGGSIPGNDPIAYKRFAYGAYLLSYNQASTKPQFGMTWGFNKPEDLFFYDFGGPEKNTSNLSDVAIAGQADLYARRFNNGLVVVNSSDSNKTYTLDKTYYQVGSDSKLSTLQKVSGTITVPKKDAVFLLNPIGSTTPPADTTKPVVNVTAPTGGSTLSGTTNIAATATDNVGVTKVDLLVDNQPQATDTTSPYSTSWSTNSTTNGSHTVSAVAYDAAGNTATSSPVTVTVNNTTTPPPIGTPANFVLLSRNFVTSTGFNLQWDPVSGATNYKLYRNGTVVVASNITKNQSNKIVAFDNTVKGFTGYNYNVTALDVSGKESAKSTSVYGRCDWFLWWFCK